jgi:hypothetical protein
MFDVNNITLMPSLIGSISTIGGTAVGAPVDRIGYSNAVAFVMAGGLVGSSGSTIGLAIKVQESPTSTGTNWTDITNEAISASSWSLSTLTFGGNLAGGDTTGTWQPYQSAKKFAKLSDGNRQRFIRCHATLNGTVGLGPKFVAGFILGNPLDIYYVQNAVTVASGNVELNKLL